MEKQNRITIICGHYGCGKTNLSLNLALSSAKAGNKTTLVDIDIVNPYFRSSEYGNLLSKWDISLIAPVYSGTTLDTPTLPPDLYSIFVDDDKEIFIDTGGDDAGIRALAGISSQISEKPYDMIYVINKSRILSGTPQEAVELLYEIEGASGLKATGIVNNSHLGVDTSWQTLKDSEGFANETAELLNLPLMYSTIPDFAVPEGIKPGSEIKIIERLVMFPWENEDIK